MKITSHKEPFGYLVIDDVYSEEELTLIWAEINFLYPKMQPAEVTLSALSEDGTFLKKNKSMFLDTTYANRLVSDILTLNKRVFSQEVREALVDLHPSYANAQTANSYTTLLNYYGDGDSYKAHADMNLYTFVTFFVKEDSDFSGGDFLFSDFGISVEQKANRVVVFPGCINHQVQPVVLKTEDSFGRFSLAQFLNYVDNRMAK